MEPRCPACDANLPAEPAIVGRDRLHGLGDGYGVLICPACGSGRTVPPVAAADLGELYPDSYTAHDLPSAQPARAAATALFRWRLWRGLRRPPLSALAEMAPGRLLDVGSGRGDLGVVMSERGWRVTGLEPAPEACRVAAGRGVEAVCGTLATATGELESGYDGATFLHSLEHVADPAEDLERVHGLLRPGGVLAISLPNFGSAQARRFLADWFHLDLPRHRSHFTATGLAALLGRTGFRVSAVSTSSSADGLPMSVRYRRLAGPPPRSGLGLHLTTTAVLALAPLGAAYDRAAGGGDVLHAAAVRQ